MQFAQRLAGEAGDICRSRGGPGRISRKADQSVVTETDHAIQAHIVGAIADTYPDHAVVAEETISEGHAHKDPTQARYCWVIDPLDGTRNYAVGFPCFSTAIAVLDRGEPIVGVVAEHNVHSVFSALRGGGVTLNGKVIHRGQPMDGGDVLIGVPSSKDELTVRVVQHWAGVKGIVLRNLGSTAVHLALVAGGGLGAAFCVRAKIWDIAAGALLVTEAGGLITDPFGQPRSVFALDGDPNENLPFLAASPARHSRLLESIRAVSPDNK
ncbi:MAG: inositol monophosphatase [Planctomycetes bacterium]|nr:inositol monophosphatase [Planctomycetota bacterium]